MIFVSVIVPVYGVELYVERCLRSVMTQGVGQSVARIECVIVDDASEDGSMTLAERLLADYEGPVTFQIVRHTKNQGLSEARNSGIAAAKGDYLLFLDGDDELTLGSIRRFADAVNRCPGVDMVIGEYAREGRYNEVATKMSRQSIRKRLESLSRGCDAVTRYIEGSEDTMRLLLHEGGMPDTAHNKLIKREILTDNSLLFRPGILHEDNLWKWHLAHHLRSVALIGEPTMIYHDTPHSIVNSLTKQHIESLCSIVEEKLATVEGTCRDVQLCNILHTLHQLEVRVRRLRSKNLEYGQMEYEAMAVRIKYYGGRLKAMAKELHEPSASLSVRLLDVKMKMKESSENKIYRLLHRLSLMLVR